MKININGNAYGLSWGMGCLRLFCDEMACELEPALEMMLGGGEYTPLQRSKSVAVAIKAAIKNYAYVNREPEPDVTTWDIEAYRDNATEADFKLITDDFLKSMIQGQTIAERFGLNLPSGTETTAKSKKKSPSASVTS